jgi:lactate dehydrogenase-like 2-hydroxyacid dehydrogenase
MKLYIFTPNKDALFTPQLEQKLSEVFEVIFYTNPSPLKVHGEFIADESEKIVALDPDYFNWSFTKEDIDLLKNTKALCLATTSFSWVDTGYAKEKGIPVTNLRGFSTEAVAEFALLMTLSVARKMPLVVKDGYKQDFVKHQGIELKGRTAAVIGLGRIGNRIAELMEGVGMKVVYWARSDKNPKYERMELADIFKKADVILPAVAQNEETASLISNEMQKSMKSDAMFVSIIHKIYNHDLMLELAKEGRIYGYGFLGDNESPLSYEGNVLAYPELHGQPKSPWRRMQKCGSML